MLPAPLQFVIAMIAYAINQRMARQLDYLQEEIRVLKEALAAATGKTRIDFSAEHRRRLALKGKELTAEGRRACCQIVCPETILAWFRQLRQATGFRTPRGRRLGVDLGRDPVLLKQSLPARLASARVTRDHSTRSEDERCEPLGFAHTVVAKAFYRQHENLLDKILRHGVALEVAQTVKVDPPAEATTQLGLGLVVAGACPDAPDELGIRDPLGGHHRRGCHAGRHPAMFV